MWFRSPVDRRRIYSAYSYRLDLSLSLSARWLNSIYDHADTSGRSPLVCPQHHVFRTYYIMYFRLFYFQLFFFFRFFRLSNPCAWIK